VHSTKEILFLFIISQIDSVDWTRTRCKTDINTDSYKT